MQAPLRLRHNTQVRAHRDPGMEDILVIGSIISAQPMDTSGIQSTQLTCAHLCPDGVHFMAPPLLGHSTHSGWAPSPHGRHSHCPEIRRVNISSKLYTWADGDIIYLLNPSKRRWTCVVTLTFRNHCDTIAGLVHANVAHIAEYHLISILRIRRTTNVTDDIFIVFDAKAFFWFYDSLNFIPATNL